MHLVRWYIENKVLLAEHSEYIDTEEVVQIFRELYALFEHHKEQVHILVDFSGVDDFHINVREYIYDMEDYYSHPALGCTITVAGKHFDYVNLMSSYMSDKFEICRETVRTWDEAMVILEKLLGENPE